MEIARRRGLRRRYFLARGDCVDILRAASQPGRHVSGAVLAKRGVNVEQLPQRSKTGRKTSATKMFADLHCLVTSRTGNRRCAEVSGAVLAKIGVNEKQLLYKKGIVHHQE